VLLLDTHVWVWQVEGEARRIGRRARQLITRAEARRLVRISPLSVFEVTALHAFGRLHLARPVEQWIQDAIDAVAAQTAVFSPRAAIDGGQLSREALPDPIDRMLVATARQLDATLVTADVRILKFARDTRAVPVIDARR
jgi:PIN domain nuclease of toxin-antitoxin system